MLCKKSPDKDNPKNYKRIIGIIILLLLVFPLFLKGIFLIDRSRIVMDTNNGSFKADKLELELSRSKCFYDEMSMRYTFPCLEFGKDLKLQKSRSVFKNGIMKNACERAYPN